MEAIVGKRVVHQKLGFEGKVLSQLETDFTYHLVQFDNRPVPALVKYDDLIVVEEDENEPKESGEAGQPSNEGKND